jgi:hypothetical protein
VPRRHPSSASEHRREGRAHLLLGFLQGRRSSTAVPRPRLYSLPRVTSFNQVPWQTTPLLNPISFMLKA